MMAGAIDPSYAEPDQIDSDSDFMKNMLDIISYRFVYGCLVGLVESRDTSVSFNMVMGSRGACKHVKKITW